MTLTEDVALPADPLALDQQVCFAVVVAARNIVGLYRPILEPMGLTHPQYLVMLALWQYGSLSVKELSGLLQLDPGTLSPLLKRLTAAGLVTRHRRVEDERSVAIALTDAGRVLRDKSVRISEEMIGAIGFDAREFDDLKQRLRLLTERVNTGQAVC